MKNLLQLMQKHRVTFSEAVAMLRAKTTGDDRPPRAFGAFTSGYDVTTGVLRCPVDTRTEVAYLTTVTGTAPTARVLVASSGSESPKDPLVDHALQVLKGDEAIYGKGNFPDDYYDQFTRKVYEKAIELTGDYGDAFKMMNKFQKAELGAEAQYYYTDVVGTDVKNGWDKVRHFIVAAKLHYDWGNAISVSGSFLKEYYDQMENLVGKDPEGYSDDDINADMAGIEFGKDIYKRYLQNNKEKNKENLELFNKIFVQKDQEAVIWFIKNFGR